MNEFFKKMSLGEISLSSFFEVNGMMDSSMNMHDSFYECVSSCSASHQ